MRVSIHAIGRIKQGPERELVARYLDRARASGKPLALTGFDVLEFAESRASSALRAEALVARDSGNSLTSKPVRLSSRPAAEARSR